MEHEKYAQFSHSVQGRQFEITQKTLMKYIVCVYKHKKCSKLFVEKVKIGN